MSEININTTSNYTNVEVIENDVIIYVKTDDMLAEVQPLVLQNISENILCNITLDTSTITCQIISEPINIVVDDLIISSIGTVSPNVYTFETPSDTWTINHNLNRKVMPQIYTLGGLEMEGNILHLNSNTLQVTFTTPMAGYVVLI